MICSIENCTLPVRAAGLCAAHYERRRRGKDMSAPVRQRLTTDHRERLRIYAPPGAPDECWIWTRSLRAGYGAMNDGRKDQSAHVVAWELANDTKVPKGMVVRHTCDIRACCNPAHLVLGTQADNMADMVGRGRSRKGSTHPRSKLNEEQVHEIHRLAASGVRQMVIAKMFGISQTNTCAILKGRAWKHVAAEVLTLDQTHAHI